MSGAGTGLIFMGGINMLCHIASAKGTKPHKKKCNIPFIAILAHFQLILKHSGREKTVAKSSYGPTIKLHFVVSTCITVIFMIKLLYNVLLKLVIIPHMANKFHYWCQSKIFVE